MILSDITVSGEPNATGDSGRVGQTSIQGDQRDVAGLPARAAQRYLDDLDAESLTTQIDGAVELLDGPDETQRAAVSVGHQVLGGVDDEW